MISLIHLSPVYYLIALGLALAPVVVMEIVKAAGLVKSGHRQD